MLTADLRALKPLIYSHVTPYGTFRLDMNQRLAIEQDAVAARCYVQRHFAPGGTNFFNGP
jgi:hypothetical protein